MGKTDDFLGECWLPPLGSLTSTVKRYVLPVANAPAEEGATSDFGSGFWGFGFGFGGFGWEVGGERRFLMGRSGLMM